MVRRLALAVALAVGVAPAFADDGARRIRDPEDTWKSIARAPDRAVADEKYDAFMLEGDTNLEYAVSASSRKVRENYVEAAITAYTFAVHERPESPEPHFRAAAAIHAFYIDCNHHEAAALCRGGAKLSGPARRHAERVIKHWDQFEAKAPKDPRLADEILFERAILHTKLETPEHLKQARADYLKLLARGPTLQSRYGLLAAGNLPETEMMLGDLDSALVHYQRALELNQSVSLYFGYAVALDRDEQGQQARAILRTFGLSGVRDLEDQIQRDLVFYVPEGEAYYYLALGYEAIGIDDSAIIYYDEFLKSGAHPQFAPRARANRAALVERRGKRKPDLRLRSYDPGATPP